MKTIISILIILAFSTTSISGNEVMFVECSDPTNKTEERKDYEGEIREVLNNEGLSDYTIELLVAQSKHESDYYRNNLTRYNNVFARHYHKSDTFAISAGAQAEGHSRFAKYPSIRAATLSQLWYLHRKGYTFKWKSPYQFALELKQKRYYEAPLETYTRALIRAMEK